MVASSLDTSVNALAAAVAILEQGETLLETLSSEVYTCRVPVAFNASIGGHYRHCLDHFSSLLRAIGADTVDYDRRERDLRIESNLEFAMETTRSLKERLESLDPDVLENPVDARCEVSYAQGSSSATGSTVGRELVYVIAHAIHHYALIAIMGRLMEASLPANFGVAPSTVAHAPIVAAGK